MQSVVNTNSSVNMPSQLRQIQSNTIVPTTFTAANTVPFPNLLRGVVHLQHWLDFSITVQVTNSNTSAGAPGGTVNPKGAVDYIQNILYKTNSISNIVNISGYQAFIIGMIQGLINQSDINTYFKNDNLFNIPTTSIAASSSETFTANYRIPINFVGTQVNHPSAMGFSTLNEAVIKNFELDITFGTIANLITGLNSGYNAEITSAGVTVYEEFYPGDLAGYQPSVYFELNIAGDQTYGAANGNDMKLTYGQGQIYKRFFVFAENTSGVFLEPSDNQISQFNLIYNSTNNLLQSVNASYSKAQYLYKTNQSLPPGVYVFDRLFAGNLLDVLNTQNFSDLKFTFNTNADSRIQIVAEKVKPNILLNPKKQ